MNIFAPIHEKLGHFLFGGTFDESANILEEFWYGNIEQSEYDASPDPEYKEILQMISRNENKLLATMNDIQKDLFSRYTDCVRECQTMCECMLFQTSFRLGAQMMKEVMK